MNSARRKQIAELIAQIEPFQDLISEVLSEEQEAFDSMPEGFQQGSRGEAAQAAIDSMEAAMDGINTSVDELNSAMAA